MPPARCRSSVIDWAIRRIAPAPEFTDPYATMLKHLACILASCTRRCRMTTWRPACLVPHRFPQWRQLVLGRAAAEAVDVESALPDP